MRWVVVKEKWSLSEEAGRSWKVDFYKQNVNFVGDIVTVDGSAKGT
jgi:hypothetical protein